MGVIFVAGIYGVGKTTLCEKLSEKLEIPHFSASDLISKEKGEQYVANKVVKDIDINQKALINAVLKELKTNSKILLSGHFCIFNSKLDIIPLPQYVFENIDIDKVLLLEADNYIVQKHLKQRDDKDYPIENIARLALKEKEIPCAISEVLSVKQICHKMTFDNDVDKVLDLLQGGCNESFT